MLAVGSSVVVIVLIDVELASRDLSQVHMSSIDPRVVRVINLVNCYFRAPWRIPTLCRWITGVCKHLGHAKINEVLTRPDSTATKVMMQKTSTIQPSIRATGITPTSEQLLNGLKLSAYSASSRPCAIAFNTVYEYPLLKWGTEGCYPEEDRNDQPHAGDNESRTTAFPASSEGASEYSSTACPHGSEEEEIGSTYGKGLVRHQDTGRCYTDFDSEKPFWPGLSNVPVPSKLKRA